MPNKLYHMGIRGTVNKSTLADALNARDYRIFEDFAKSLIPQALALYQNDPIDPEVGHTVYAFDSTTIYLCLSVFQWADFRKTKASIKLHTLLNLRGAIPVQIEIGNAKSNDAKGMAAIKTETGAIYLFDRAYLCFEELYRFEQAGAYFVTRSKSNTRVQRRYSAPADKTSGVQCDQTVVLVAKKAVMPTKSRYAA
jgi:hypothetical protein